MTARELRRQKAGDITVAEDRIRARRCWCGETNPYFSDDFAEACGGTGMLDCFCGGDLCICHWHGQIECTGCEDCQPEYDDESDFPDVDVTFL